MAYMSQETKKAIAAELKKIMPKAWKYSLAVRDHSTISLTIASAPIDLMKIVRESRAHGMRDSGRDNYAQLNQFYLSTEFKGNDEMCKLFEKIYSTLKGPEFFDHSDSQTDYFHVSHYISINLGKWDKPFIVTGADGGAPVATND
jgi:hypothetical protein